MAIFLETAWQITIDSSITKIKNHYYSDKFLLSYKNSWIIGCKGYTNQKRYIYRIKKSACAESKKVYLSNQKKYILYLVINFWIKKGIAIKLHNLWIKKVRISNQKWYICTIYRICRLIETPVKISTILYRPIMRPL